MQDFTASRTTRRAWCRVPARHTALASALAAALLSGNGQAAGTPDPGDYLPAPAGSTVLALYAQQARADKVYSDGQKVESNLGLRLDIGVARLMHYTTLGGKTVDVEAILPFARQRVTSVDDRMSGVGNLQLGGTVWLQEDEAAGRYAAVAAYLTLPTGAHRDRGFAISEDRYALDVEAAYIFPLGRHWSLDLIGQVEAYTHDRTTQVQRRPLVRGFAHLSYHWSQQTRLAFSVRQSWGASERQDGQTVLGARRDTNLMLTWAHQLDERWQVQAQYAQDVRVRNGSPVRALQLRTVLLF